MTGFSNKPKILKGAFVEHGLSNPPLVVAFQFNPESISRDRTNTFSAPGETKTSAGLYQWHQKYNDLSSLKDQQVVEFGSETISFDIRLDATDKLDEGDPIAQQYGIAPQMSTLELMMEPQTGQLAILQLIGAEQGYTFSGKEKPPMILFVWGRKKVLPVNLTSIKVKEEEFSTDLNPIRATIGVSLTVIEGPNLPYQYTKAMRETLSGLNLAHSAEVAEVIIPR